MPVTLEELFGVDPNDPAQRLAADLVAADDELLDLLVDLRKQRGLGMEEIAISMGVSEAAVAQIESGERDPRLSTLRRYAHAVSASVSHAVTPAIFSSLTAPAIWQDDWTSWQDWNVIPAHGVEKLDV